MATYREIVDITESLRYICENLENILQKDLGTEKYQSLRESVIQEAWGTPTRVSPSEKGKYEGKTKAELLKSYNALKKRGPHKKGSPEYGRMRELAFAIRAKSGWGKVE